MIQLRREELLKLNNDLRKQLANERKEIVDLRLENYSLKTRIKSYRREWLEMLNANVNLSNIIKTFDRYYFDRLEEIEKEKESDNKGM